MPTIRLVYSYPPAWPPAPPARSGQGLAVAALAVSIVALLGVAATAVGLLVFLGGGFGEPLTGSVAPDGAGAVGAASLTRAVTDRIEDDGGGVDDMTCPATPRVAQGAVTVCHGTIDDVDWAVVVYFESAQGDFTLGPI